MQRTYLKLQDLNAKSITEPPEYLCHCLVLSSSYVADILFWLHLTRGPWCIYNLCILSSLSAQFLYKLVNFPITLNNSLLIENYYINDSIYWTC